MIVDAALARVRAAADLVDIAGEHTELKRVGAVSAIYLPSIARKPDGTGWYMVVEVENVLPGRRAFPAPAATG